MLKYKKQLLTILLSAFLCCLPFLANYMARTECHNFENPTGLKVEYIEWSNCYIEINKDMLIKYSGVKVP